MPIIFVLGLAGVMGLEEAGLFFLPGDIALAAAGLRAHPDAWSLLLCWIAGSVAMIAGACLLFKGVSWTHVTSRFFPQRVARFVRTRGILGVTLARLVPGLRNATVFAAASSEMRFRDFFLGLVPSAFAWCALMLLLGWFGGAAMLALLEMLQRSTALQAVTATLVAVAGAFFVVRFWLTRARSRSATNRGY